MPTPIPRAFHGLTAVVVIAALVLQLVLVLTGSSVLDETDPPPLGLRLGRLVSYFTIQSNVLIAVASTQLARNPLRDGTLWRGVRLAGLLGITVTGVVHFVLLRPLLDLDGADWVADKLLHVAVPLLAIVGWAWFGPRPRVDGRAIKIALCWPVLWLAWTLVIGASSGWYPYPFLDHREEAGVEGVVVSIVGITAFLALLIALAASIDKRARPMPRSVAKA